MIVQDRSQVKEQATYRLEPVLIEFIAAEALEFNVAESDVASLAIALLAHYRNQTRQAKSVLLYPAEANDLHSKIRATSVPHDTRSALLTMGADLSTFEVDVQAEQQGTSGRPVLRIIR